MRKSCSAAGVGEYVGLLHDNTPQLLRPAAHFKEVDRMRIVLIAMLMVVGMVTAAMAAPFLVCDPQTGVQYYQITGASYLSGNIIAQTDGSLRVDVGSAVVGTTNLTVKACKADTAWGEVCSVSVPFALVRPAAPVAPIGIKLAP
jgi:hypothetical protein